MAGRNKFSIWRGNPTTAATAIGLFITASSAFGIDSTPARAHVSPQAYEIPAGSVADALNALADESGAQLLYDAALTRHLKTAGVSGQHTLDGALRKLLIGTGLTFEIEQGGRSVSIVLAEADTGRRSDASGAHAHPLPPIEIGAARARQPPIRRLSLRRRIRPRRQDAASASRPASRRSSTMSSPKAQRPTIRRVSFAMCRALLSTMLAASPACRSSTGSPTTACMSPSPACPFWPPAPIT